MRVTASFLCIALAGTILFSWSCSAKNERKRTSAKAPAPPPAASVPEPAKKPIAAKPAAAPSTAPAATQPTTPPATASAAPPAVAPAVAVAYMTVSPVPVILTVEEFPRVVCTESVQPLAMMAACMLTGTPYRWGSRMEGKNQVQGVYPVTQGDAKKYEAPPVDFRPAIPADKINAKLMEKVQVRSTAEAYAMLKDGKADMLIVPDQPGRNVEFAAGQIVQDTVSVLVHRDNPVADIPRPSLQSIYAGEVKEWREFGGGPNKVMAIVVTSDGSIEAIKKCIMEGANLAKNLTPAATLTEMVYGVSAEKERIGYAPHYFLRYMCPIPGARAITIDGQPPDADMIASYPCSMTILYVTRQDVKPGSPTEKLGEWLRSREARAVFLAGGYAWE